MKKRTLVTLLAIAIIGIFSIAASAQNTHSVWTNSNGFYVTDPQTSCAYTSFSGFDMATSWTEPAPPTYAAIAHFRGVTKAIGFSVSCPTAKYFYQLRSTSSTTNDQINGTWDVFRNGVLVCSSCNGTAYGLNQAAGVGNYYKVYVDDPVFGPQTWLYSGFIDVRKDF